MGVLDNAAKLIKDVTFQDWCMAAAAYQARLVILEDASTPDHLDRLNLATSVVNNPDTFRSRFTVYVATDPSVSGKGATAALVTEATVLDKVATIWTTVSQVGLTTQL